MMMGEKLKKNRKLGIIWLILSVGFCHFGVTSHAATLSTGGDVSTTSGITFHQKKDSVVPPQSRPEPDTEKKTRPTRHLLPQTGEEKSLNWIKGLLLLLILGLVSVKRRRKYEG